MLERFQGEQGMLRLVEAIRTQGFVEGNVEAARSLAELAKLEEYETGTIIIEQGADDNDIVLIVSGSTGVFVNGREVALRVAGQHVGEMALIDPRYPRSATIVAREKTVVARVAEADFTSIAEAVPRLWRKLATEMSHRLRQRNELVREKNNRPILFIGSSVEKIDIARAIQSLMEYDDVEIRLWTQPNIFTASSYPMDDLERQIEISDFALLVVSGEDKITSRNVIHLAPRDNIIFEIGLFIGGISRIRTMIIQERGVDVKIPTDILGITPLTYEAVESKRLVTALGSAVNEIRQKINDLGSR